MFFAPAVLFSALVGGIGPGVFAWVCGLVLGDYMFTGSRFSFGPFGAAQVTLMATYSFTGWTGIFLIQLVQRLKQKAESHSHTLEEEILRRKEAEAELRQAQEALREHAKTLERAVRERTRDLEDTVLHLEGVLYHLAHDLRSPLRAMAGYSALMKEHYQPKLGMAEEDWAERITEASVKMDTLLQDLLAYGKLGHQPFPCARQELEPPLNRALLELHGQVVASGAEVQINRPLPEVWANAEALRQIFLQLLSNALKFVQPGVPPKIRVWTEPTPEGVKVWVEDNGIGIEPQHAERVFRVFEQLRGEEFEGHGIGLAIVRKIVSRMEGEVGVVSEPGKGTRFWLVLKPAQEEMVKSRENAVLHLG